MSVALWCVLWAGLLPYVATGAAKLGARGFDNRDPRAWLERQSGLRRRANAAQLNSFEAFPFFAASVLAATAMHAPTGRVDALAVTFVAARVAYLACYLADWHLARSVVWMVGITCPVGLFVVAAG